MPFLPIGRNIVIPPPPTTQPTIDYYECPTADCDCDTLEEVARAITYTTIDCFYQEIHEYGSTDTEYMEAIRIQCKECGFTVAEGFPDDLFLHCLERGWIRGREATGAPAADWEA